MTNPDIRKLLNSLVKKYLEGTATEQEEKFIKQYYRYFDRNKPASDQFTPDEKTRLENKLWQAISKEIEQPRQRQVVPLYRRTPFRAIAAIIAFLLVSTGVYFWLNRQGSLPDSIQEATTDGGDDLLPGGNKAVLTLGDGSQILLEDASEGMLGRQGNTKINKSGDGELEYQSTAAGGSDTKQSAVAYNILSTPRGGQYRLVLPDGSKVWLNAASSIRYPAAFTGKERPVELSGEAYFEIARDAGKPFRVTVAGGIEVEVLGTHFNIMAYEEENAVRTTLLEGSVRVTAGGNTKLLKPGFQVISDENQSALEVHPAIVEEVIAWQKGLFHFQSADIASIMRQLGRWYDVEVVYEQGIPDGHITGKIPRNMKASQVLKILELSGVHFRIEGKKIIVMSH